MRKWTLERRPGKFIVNERPPRRNRLDRVARKRKPERIPDGGRHVGDRVGRRRRGPQDLRVVRHAGDVETCPRKERDALH